MRAQGGHGSGMTRNVRRIGAWLALLSLLLQFGATIGHFHPEDFAAAFGAASGFTLTQGHAQPQGPAGLAGHDDCALCVSLNLVGASALPEAARLPLPDEKAHGRAVFPPAPHFAAAPRPPFQTRAPPLA